MSIAKPQRQNSNWSRGIPLAVGYAAFSSCTYAYLAHVNKVFELRQEIAMLVVGAWKCATSLPFCTYKGMERLSRSDIPLILLQGNIAVAWFFGVVCVSPLAMTICSALVLVPVYFFEQWWFVIPYEIAPMLSAMGIVGAVMGYGLSSASDARTRSENEADLEGLVVGVPAALELPSD